LRETDGDTAALDEQEASDPPESNILRRAKRYLESFPDTSLEVIAGHIAVVHTGAAMGRAVTRHLEQYGINPARYSLMRAIYFAPDRMLPQSKLAREMGTSQPNVTQLLHALEREGLVERVIFPDNRRVTFARLTDEGLARCEVLVPDMVQFMQRSMAGLSTEELEQLHRLLSKVRGIVEEL
jgi:MarR family 2-MHQ and catechol resistance regulon transcriptional repressor